MGPSAEAYLIVVKRKSAGGFTAAHSPRLAEETVRISLRPASKSDYGRTNENQFANARACLTALSNFYKLERWQ